MSYQRQGGQQNYGSYNNSYEQTGNPYGQTGNPYGQTGNPYGQTGNPYGQEQGNPYAQGRYDDNQPTHQGRPEPQPQTSSYYGNEEQGAGRYEMANINGSDPNRILNECRAIDGAIDEMEGELERLKGLQNQYLRDIDSSKNSALRQATQSAGDNLMNKYKSLVSRVKKLKQNPESGNPRNAPQVGKVDRRLKTAVNQFQQADREYRREARDQMARQYRIVRPDASDAEVREATEQENQQVFSQALIQQDRRGQVASVAQNVTQRHDDIQKIERQMIELAQLFQDLEAAVVQQEPAVTQIEQRGEEVTDHVAKANTELDGAVTKAKAARRKKWICLGIVVAIIVVVVVVVVVVVEVNKK